MPIGFGIIDWDKLLREFRATRPKIISDMIGFGVATSIRELLRVRFEGFMSK